METNDKMKNEFDDAMHSRTITFENNSINDYDYYEIIF